MSRSRPYVEAFSARENSWVNVRMCHPGFDGEYGEVTLTPVEARRLARALIREADLREGVVTLNLGESTSERRDREGS